MHRCAISRRSKHQVAVDPLSRAQGNHLLVQHRTPCLFNAIGLIPPAYHQSIIQSPWAHPGVLNIHGAQVSYDRSLDLQTEMRDSNNSNSQYPCFIASTAQETEGLRRSWGPDSRISQDISGRTSLALIDAGRSLDVLAHQLWNGGFSLQNESLEVSLVQSPGKSCRILLDLQNRRSNLQFSSDRNAADQCQFSG
ncbi:hypothetical protein BT63DRAFT_311118 [Microthyrium microscopicum]|uniref:Uncharacterized protein n=1 Tax=Microthyrium microscopicum TaxID=703497 RepID=A0A6A6U4H1_9PEZI|nr:hypothetical protein BT63DRAFT_311118 [Microthyrium microscopicum]